MGTCSLWRLCKSFNFAMEHKPCKGFCKNLDLVVEIGKNLGVVTASAKCAN